MGSNQTISTDLGEFLAVWRGDSLVSLQFGAPKGPYVPARTRAQKALEQYLAGYQKGQAKAAISFQLAPEGTTFEKAVWRALLKVPYGSRISYAQLAKTIGRPSSHRAVGNAVGKNPFPIVVPCHRVVRSDGTLGGYSGPAGMKRRLLALEEYAEERT